jgi:hypothetical protein
MANYVNKTMEIYKNLDFHSISFECNQGKCAMTTLENAKYS